LQSEAARKVIAKGLSVRETEQWVRRVLASGPKRKSNIRPLDPDIRKLQDDLSEKLGANVIFQHAASGKGKLIVQYNSVDELDGILAHLK
jgi:ParB family chromosome partitioning protein